jgi:6-pyruvoyltetrahydropterin/6-carboxytetrahydropterin synthase
MMTFSIGKQYSFCGAHHIEGLPEGHKCRRVHGHTYTVEFVLTAKSLVAPGFVADFGDLAPAGTYIRETLDHSDLNEVLREEPTSEAIAAHLATWYLENLAGSISGRLKAVRVWESPTSWAECELDDGEC